MPVSSRKWYEPTMPQAIVASTAIVSLASLAAFGHMLGVPDWMLHDLASGIGSIGVLVMALLRDYLPRRDSLRPPPKDGP